MKDKLLQQEPESETILIGRIACIAILACIIIVRTTVADITNSEGGFLTWIVCTYLMWGLVKSFTPKDKRWSLGKETK